MTAKKKTEARVMTNHAIAIVSKGEKDAHALWSHGWMRLTDEHRRALVALYSVRLMNVPRVRAAATPQTLIDVLEMLATWKG